VEDINEGKLITFLNYLHQVVDVLVEVDVEVLFSLENMRSRSFLLKLILT